MTEAVAPPVVKARGEEALYFEMLKKKSLVYHRCRGCEASVFPLRTVCSSCGSEELEMLESTGNGVVHSFTVQHRAASYFKDKLPLVIVLIDLDEGFRMLADMIECTPEEVEVGSLVSAVFDAVTADLTLVRFRPAAGEGDQK